MLRHEFRRWACCVTSGESRPSEPEFPLRGKIWIFSLDFLPLDTWQLDGCGAWGWTSWAKGWGLCVSTQSSAFSRLCLIQGSAPAALSHTRESYDLPWGDTPSFHAALWSTCSVPGALMEARGSSLSSGPGAGVRPSHTRLWGRAVARSHFGWGFQGQSPQVPAAGSVCPLQAPCVSWLSLTELPFPSHTPRPIQPPPSLQSFPTSFNPRLLQTPTHGPACRCPGEQGPGSALRSNGAPCACTRWTGRCQVPGQSCSPGPRAEHAPGGQPGPATSNSLGDGTRLYHMSMGGVPAVDATLLGSSLCSPSFPASHALFISHCSLIVTWKKFHL